ncbi:unnamed protein product [Porites evermanni]|uniref:Uncharacterized protein n=1 Tax=Porites evermanni TaxID=104178 RepID=A0ABN8T2V7_9CNID|nr:unnamed protein product [Porites evermanni]
MQNAEVTKSLNVWKLVWRIGTSGFGQEDIEVTKKKKGARDRKHHSLSMGSEVDDEEGKSAQGDDLEKMVVPKPTAKDKEADSDSDDDAFDNKSVFVSDFDLMIQKKKEMNKTMRRKRKVRA